MRGRWFAAMAASSLLAFACAPPLSKVDVQPSTSPSPSPTPTVPVTVSASAPFHGGEVGIAYSPVPLSATGGVAPYKWSVSSGTLPGGLTLGSEGSVSGTPHAAGSFTFTIQVADSGDGSATLPGTISIAGALSAALIPSCASYCHVEIGCASVCGAFGQQGGGVGPYAYTMTQGPLPAGTYLNGLSLAGTFSGLSGWLQFTVQVADALGATATVAPKFWMYDHITLASASCYRIFTDCSLKLAIGGGVPGGNPSVAITNVAAAPGQGCWPATPTPQPPYTLTVSGGYVNLYIPRPGNGYGGVWTLVLTDHSYCSSGAYCNSNSATATVGIECT